MLLPLVLLVYAFMLSHFMGVHVCVLLQRWLKVEPTVFPGFGLSNLIGLAVMSPVISIYHFFFSIDLTLHLFFVSFLLINYQFTKLNVILLRDHIKSNALFFSVTFAAAVISVISRPGTGDIADYHLQAIKWAEHYPNVIGLGNFNRPLANNNWWFNLQAFFGFSWFGIGSIYICNALLFISALQIFILSKPVNSAHAIIRFVFALFTVMSVKTAFIGSVTPDIVVTTVIFIIVDLYYRCTHDLSQQKHLLLIMMLLISWVLTVKATAIILFLIPLPLLYSNFLAAKQWKAFIGISIIVAVFLIPWFIGNVIACGYLLYPFNNIDLFNVDWKVPAYFFEYDKIVLSSWGKISGQDIYLTKTYSVRQWLPVWFSKLDMLNTCLVIAYVLSIPLLFIRSIRQKEFLWPFIFLQIGFTIIFLNGPHPRFLFPYMVATAALALASMESYLKFSRPFFEGKSVRIVLVTVCLVLTLNVLINQIKTLPLTALLLKPKPYPDLPLKEISIDGFKAFITKSNNSCWDKFPSSYYFIDSVSLRGIDIKKGFSIKH